MLALRVQALDRRDLPADGVGRRDAEHARTDVPSKWTVQAPHWPMPQPNFVPVSRRRSRITQSRGVGIDVHA